MEKFSVIICVYHKDNALWLKEAIESVTVNQSYKPDELIVVVDGPIFGKLKEFVDSIYIEYTNSKTIKLPENLGHAGARQAGLDACTNDLVAIMDADDIADSRRFELQVQAFLQNTDVSVIGGQISEFCNSSENIVGRRIVPCQDNVIKSYLKARCPMNLVTVMMRKSKIIQVGGFLDWYCEEDYYLWIRLCLAGHKFYNINEILVNVRVGSEMYQRRGGWRYFRSEAKLQRYMLQHRLILFPRYLYNVIGRFIVQVATPNKLRSFIFQKLFRQ